MAGKPESNTANRTLGLCVAAGCLCIACDAQLGDIGQTVSTVNPDGSVGMSMTPPDGWLTLRRVDVESLRLSVTLDGVPQASTRTADDRWHVTFTLPDNNSHAVQATWSEQLPDREMILAISEEVPVSNVQEERVVTISEYMHRDFDDDNDGISNLDERRLGRDPLVVDRVTPGEGQSDCRVNTASISFGNFFVGVESPGFNAPLAVASTAIVPDLNSFTTEGMLVVFESFFVLTPGELTVSHFGGPASTGALLYDTDVNGVLRELARDNVPLVGEGVPFDNRRAVVTGSLQPGLYCYRLESTQLDELVIDPALQYSFTASR